MTVKQDKVSAVDNVKAEWGADAPQWILDLAAFCDEHSQAEAGRKLRRSASLVNSVLRNRYAGDLADVQSRVETMLDKAGRQCPVLGKISGARCIEEQSTRYEPSNHFRVAMFRACRKCPHSNSIKGGN